MEKFAIIGMACLFPEAQNTQTYWQNLINRRDSRSIATQAQMGINPDELYSPTRTPDKYYSMRGGYIHDFNFDPLGYQLSVDELMALDELHHWSLYAAHEALRDSGYDQADLARAGVIMGNLSFPTRASHQLINGLYADAVYEAISDLLGEDLPLQHLEFFDDVSAINASMSGSPASVIAKALGLGGTNFALDAACASSLYAVKLACDYLSTGKADMMLAGAVSRSDPYNINMGFSIFSAYPEQHETSSPLNNNSAGLVAAEGAGFLVIKRLEDALADGDTIHAVISGVGLSNDGRGKHLLTPNSAGQIRAYERAYAHSDITPDQIQYIECHATGTPLGDVTELNSMQAFFGDHQPLIGSVKGNLGHLLTAAGMSGIMKVILAMSHHQLPATLHIDNPLTSERANWGAGKIVTQTTEWTDERKIAAVSAFGFGGCNAHLILEQHPHQYTPMDISEKLAPMAIIGMDAFFGELDGLTAFEHAIFDGEPAFIPLPRERWGGINNPNMPVGATHVSPELNDDNNGRGVPRPYNPTNVNIPPLHAMGRGLGGGVGAYITSFEMDFLRFKIPPAADDQPIPQQTLMLKVADRALRDAQIQEGGNVAVIIAMNGELELHKFRGRVDLGWQIRDALAREGIQLSEDELAHLESIARDALHTWPGVNQYVSFIGNIVANRISSAWDFSGASFTLSAEENGVSKALEIAQMMLSRGEADAVLVGAVDLAGGIENVTARSLIASIGTTDSTFGWDANNNGWHIGEGAGAVVLKTTDQAHADGNRIYATIEGIGIAHGDQPNAESFAYAIGESLRLGGATPDDIGFISLSASGIEAQDEAEMLAMAHIYEEATQPIALISSKALIGHTYNASGMASLIQSALVIYRRTIPALANYHTPQKAGFWRNLPFYFPTTSRPLFTTFFGDVRGMVNIIGGDGSHAHIALSAGDVIPTTANLRYVVLPVSGTSSDDLQARLTDLIAQLQNGASVTDIQAKAIAQHDPTHPYGGAIIGKNRAELHSEAVSAQKGVATAFEKGRDWESKIGSSFTAKPDNGDVALVYPGAFNAYVGMGGDLLYNLPALNDISTLVGGDLRRLVADKLLYPRTINRPSDADYLAQQTALADNPPAMMQAGSTFAWQYTRLVKLLGVQPRAMFGYSMGEASMMWGAEIWSHAHLASELLHTSNLFTSKVVGKKTAARHYLGDTTTPDDELWGNYVIATDPDTVRQALADEPTVFLTHINTPNQVAIAGEKVACERVLAKIGAGYVQAMPAVLHCPPTQNAHADFVRLHNLPISSPPPTPSPLRGERAKAEANLTVSPFPHSMGEGSGMGVRLYGSDGRLITATDSDAIAHELAHDMVQIVDFPHLVNTVYHDGARVFIEVGAQNTCTRWIRDILRDKPHVAIATNRMGVSDSQSIARLIAKLISHRVPMNLSVLVRPSTENTSNGKKQLIQTITLGKTPIREAILSDANRAWANNLHKQFVEPIHQWRNLRVERGERLKNPFGGLALPITIEQTDDMGDHERALVDHRNTLQQLAEMIEKNLTPKAEGQSPLSMQWGGDLGEGINRPPRPVNYSTPENVIWDEKALEEFATGKIANVFGHEYAIIDTYKSRVRLPAHPYLLVTRITKLDAEIHQYRPSAMTTEYDIPFDAWYSVDGQIPWAVSVESGQCDLMLISYIGIDFEAKGRLMYRLLDCTLNFLKDMPKEGHTLRYDIRINSYAKSGDNLLFFFEYDCYVGDECVLTMRNGCAGFFSNEDLDAGKGIIMTQKERDARAKIVKQHFEPLLQTIKRHFSKDDLRKLSDGDIAGTFGDTAYDLNGRSPSLRLPSGDMLLLDRIADVDPNGGAWGLGQIIGEKDLHPDDWYFPCHFVDDQVMAGSLVAEGCVQMMQVYMMYLGLHLTTDDARFQPIHGLPQVVRCRGQVGPQIGKLIYRLEIKEIGTSPEPYAIADVDVILNDKIVVDFKDLGLKLSEKSPEDKALYGREILAWADGRAEARPYMPVSDIPIAVRDGIAIMKDAPINEWHLEQFAFGSIADCFGEDFRLYDGRLTPRQPNTYLKLISRIVRVNGTRFVFDNTPSLISEYDVPLDAWYYDRNHAPTMPYSILMEIGLQPCGFLSAWLGSTLEYPQETFFFRNLDGDGKLHHMPELRGKTITNHVSLTSSTSYQGMIIQKFTYALSVDGVTFYDGTASFGYFSTDALANQVGLDRGNETYAWMHTTQTPAYLVDLTDPATREAYQTAPEGKPHHRLGDDMLIFLDSAEIIGDGGEHGMGYVHATKFIDPTNWFYACHFYQDPVMPGSLGVEAILQALQIFAMTTGLADEFASPRYDHLTDHQFVWKYRGQVIPKNQFLHLEVHISAIERADDGGIILRGNANLWRENIRIYEVRGVALKIGEVN